MFLIKVFILIYTNSADFDKKEVNLNAQPEIQILKGLQHMCNPMLHCTASSFCKFADLQDLAEKGDTIVR